MKRDRLHVLCVTLVLMFCVLPVSIHAAKPAVPQNPLFGVWGSSGRDVYTVGGFGTILHYDGSQWEVVTDHGAPFAWFYGVWGSSGHDVFVVGGYEGGDENAYDIIVHYDGATWTIMHQGAPASLRHVWGTSDSNIFAVGDHGKILQYDGQQWSAMPSGTSENLKQVWGSSAQDIFIVGTHGSILHYDGHYWQPMNSGTAVELEGIWGSSNNNVFAVGEHNTILQYDGRAWTPMPVEKTTHLQGVWGSSADYIFAAGGNPARKGVLLRYENQQWRSIATESSTWFYAVWGSMEHDVFAVGDQGKILHYTDGQTALVAPSLPAPTASSFPTLSLNLSSAEVLPSINLPHNPSWPPQYSGDLAWNKPTFASSYWEDGYPARCTSGQGAWRSAESTGAWLYVDLGQPSTFQHIVTTLYVDKNFSQAPRTTYMISNDLKTWERVIEETNPDNAIKRGHPRTLTLSHEVTARYVGVYAAGWDGGWADMGVFAILP